MSAKSEVALRPFRDSDWPTVHAWARDPQVCRHQPWGPNSEEGTREFVRTAIDEMARRPQARWAYAVLLGKEVVGSCELNLRGQPLSQAGFSAVRPGLACRTARCFQITLRKLSTLSKNVDRRGGMFDAAAQHLGTLRRTGLWQLS